jgi:hypothetical protein
MEALMDKKTRVRSPNYPFLTLEKGIEFVKGIYEHHNRYSVATEVAAKDMGVSPKGSYLAQHLAALSQYGLIDLEGETGSRKIKISDLAFKIMVDQRPDSEERDGLIKEAALKPTTFRKIFDAYPSGLPADSAIEYKLKAELAFNPKSVGDFISNFKSTMDYAKVYKSGIMGQEKTPIKEPDMNATDKVQVKDVPNVRISPPPITLDEREIANYPVGPGRRARIFFSGGSPTVESIEKLIKLLELNKEDFPLPGNNSNENKSN